MNLANRIIDLGINKQTDVIQTRHIRFTNSVIVILFFFIIENVAISIYFHQPLVTLVFLMHFILISLTLLFNHMGKRVLASAWFSGVAILFVSIYSIIFTERGYNFVFLPMIIFLQFFLFSAAEKKYIFIFTAITVFCLAGVLFWPAFHLQTLIPVSKVGLPCLSIAFGLYAFITISRADREVAKEKDKTDQLLLNILPQSIAQRFKNDQSYLAEEYKSVTVLFADIVSFTSLSEKLKPDVLVGFLNKIFSEFDYLAELYGLEKIKTIGDAYMVAGGVPIPCDDHTRKICRMAIKMQEVAKDILTPFEEQVSIRIGINTGPAIAGVIGVKKFIYDLWGDTVNTASRMESYAEAGKIQITTEVYELIKNEFECQSRGLINVKGKGSMTTYFLMGAKE
jgi:adenylate cyclase